jgi:hypothetical protein
MRKTRSDSVLDGLPENQRAAIERWLVDENLSLKDARERVFQDFGVRCSPTAFSQFAARCRQSRMLRQIAESSSAAKAVTDQFRNDPDTSFEALLGLVGQAAFEMKMSGKQLDLGTLKDLAEIMALGLKVKTDTKKIQQKDQQLNLAERKFRRDTAELFVKWAEDKRAKEIITAGVSNSEKIERLGELMFGEDWKDENDTKETK